MNALVFSYSDVTGIVDTCNLLCECKAGQIWPEKKQLSFSSGLFLVSFSRAVCTAGQLLNEHTSSRFSKSSSRGSSGRGGEGGSGQQEHLKPPARKVRVSPRLLRGVFCCSGDGERYGT